MKFRSVYIRDIYIYYELVYNLSIYHRHGMGARISLAKRFFRILYLTRACSFVTSLYRYIDRDDGRAITEILGFEIVTFSRNQNVFVYN